MVAAYLLYLIALDYTVNITLDLVALVSLDDQVAVAPDPFAAIIFDPHVEVLLAVNKDLFLAFLVFEAKLVESFAAFRRVGLETAFGLFVRQGIGWRGFSIIDPAGNNRAVRIALKKTY